MAGEGLTTGFTATQESLDSGVVTPYRTSKSLVELSDAWALKCEWRLATFGYTLAATSEQPHLSRDAWLAVFYSAMAILIDESIPATDSRWLEIVVSACGVVTDGATRNEYDVSADTDLMQEIDNTTWEEGRSGLVLEQARHMLNTKACFNCSSVANQVLGKSHAIDEQIEAHLILASVASLRKGDSISVKESFADAMKLKFGDTPVLAADAHRRLDNFIEGVRRFVEILWKRPTGYERKNEDLPLGGSRSTKPLAELLKVFRKMSLPERIGQRLQIHDALQQLEVEDYHRLIFKDLKNPATANGLQAWLDENRGSRCTPQGIPFTAKALQHFSKKLNVLFEVDDPKTGQPILCRIEGRMREDRHTALADDYFAFVPPGKGQREVTTPVSLPAVRVKSRAGYDRKSSPSEGLKKI